MAIKAILIAINVVMTYVIMIMTMRCTTMKTMTIDDGDDAGHMRRCNVDDMKKDDRR